MEWLSEVADWFRYAKSMLCPEGMKLRYRKAALEVELSKLEDAGEGADKSRISALRDEIARLRKEIDEAELNRYMK